MAGRLIKIGARGSRLSQIQANTVIDLLRLAYPSRLFEPAIIKTSGDIDVHSPMHKIGGVGAFTRQIEGALLAGEIDIAVHSAKDLPSRNTDGLAITAVPKRGRIEDVLISNGNLALEALKPNSVIGTSSPRRRAMLLNIRNDLKVSDIRGNVETRIAKMRDGSYDAIILALAGLTRMGLETILTSVLTPEKFIPAAGQGALAIQTRVDDSDMLQITQAIDDMESHHCLDIERALLSRLNAGCNVAVGVWARYIGERVKLTVAALEKDGKRRIDAESEISINQSEIELVDQVHQQLKIQGAMEIIKEYDQDV
jgi:hydroxymethylbilane synthase